MPDIWMDVDTAVQVPVSLMPLVDRTDFITIEDAIAFDEAGMAVVWNFVTTAGVMTTTAITPTSASDHDWLEEGTNQGMYSIEIPASAGDANNDTEGVGWITGETNSCLPFRGPTIGFRAAALNNALIDGGDLLDVNVTQMVGGTVPAPATTGIPDVNVREWLDTAVTAGTAGTPDVNTVRIFNNILPALILERWLNEAKTSTADSGTTTTLVDASLSEADDRWNGALLVFTTGTNNGYTAIVTDFDAATDTITFTPAAPNAVTTEDYILIPGLGWATRDLANTTDGLGALKALLDAIPTTAMRGTDSAALASEVTSARMATLTDWINGGRLDLLLDAIKVVTDKFAFTNTNEVDANTKSINDAEVVGDGNATRWDGA